MRSFVLVAAAVDASAVWAGCAILGKEVLLRQLIAFIAVFLYLDPELALQIERIDIVSLLGDGLDATEQEELVVVRSH